jgi:hypothetical protein
LDGADCLSKLAGAGLEDIADHRTGGNWLSLLKQGKLSMPATMEELRKDRDALLKEEAE